MFQIAQLLRASFGTRQRMHSNYDIPAFASAAFTYISLQLSYLHLPSTLLAFILSCMYVPSAAALPVCHGAMLLLLLLLFAGNSLAAAANQGQASYMSLLDTYETYDEHYGKNYMTKGKYRDGSYDEKYTTDKVRPTAAAAAAAAASVCVMLAWSLTATPEVMVSLDA
jgi:hypothetical protein